MALVAKRPCSARLRIPTTDAMSQPHSDRLGFVRNPLVRHNAEGDHEALQRALDDSEARTILIAGDVPILRRLGESATSLLPLADLGRLPAQQEQVLLGSSDHGPVLATLAEASAVDLFRGDPLFQPLDLRSIAFQGAVSAD